MSNFEERLLVELRQAVPAEAPRGRRYASRRRLALAGGLVAVAAAATAGGFLLTAGAQPAYAVTKNADGTITVQVDSMSDAAGLQAALQADGVNAVVQYLPEGKMCAQPWYTPAGHVAESEGSTVGAGPGNGETTFTISGDHPSGETLVITTQTGSGREQALGVGWAQGTVPACQVVDAPAGSGPLGGPPTS